MLTTNVWENDTCTTAAFAFQHIQVKRSHTEKEDQDKRMCAFMPQQYSNNILL